MDKQKTLVVKPLPKSLPTNPQRKTPATALTFQNGFYTLRTLSGAPGPLMVATTSSITALSDISSTTSTSIAAGDTDTPVTASDIKSDKTGKRTDVILPTAVLDQKEVNNIPTSVKEQREELNRVQVELRKSMHTHHMHNHKLKLISKLYHCSPEELVTAKKECKELEESIVKLKARQGELVNAVRTGLVSCLPGAQQPEHPKPGPAMRFHNYKELAPTAPGNKRILVVTAHPGHANVSTSVHQPVPLKQSAINFSNSSIKVTNITRVKPNSTSSSPLKAAMVSENSQQPTTPVDGQPTTQVDGQPTTQVDGQPAAAVNGQPATAVNGQPAAAVNGQPATAVNGQPEAVGCGSTSTVNGQQSFTTSGQSTAGQPAMNDQPVPAAVPKECFSPTPLPITVSTPSKSAPFPSTDTEVTTTVVPTVATVPTVPTVVTVATTTAPTVSPQSIPNPESATSTPDILDNDPPEPTGAPVSTAQREVELMEHSSSEITNVKVQEGRTLDEEVLAITSVCSVRQSASKPQLLTKPVSISPVFSTSDGGMYSSISETHLAAMRKVRAHQPSLDEQTQQTHDFMASIGLVPSSMCKKLANRRAERRKFSRSRYDGLFETRNPRANEYLSSLTNAEACKRPRRSTRTSPVPPVKRSKRSKSKTASVPGLSDDEGALHEDMCAVCEQTGELLLCDTCVLVYHLSCVKLTSIPPGKWSCPKCVQATQSAKSTSKPNSRATSKAAASPPLASTSSQPAAPPASQPASSRTAAPAAPPAPSHSAPISSHTRHKTAIGVVQEFVKTKAIKDEEHHQLMEHNTALMNKSTEIQKELATINNVVNRMMQEKTNLSDEAARARQMTKTLVDIVTSLKRLRHR